MSLFQPKTNGKARTPYWHYEFQWRGRRFRGSTGQTSKAKAREVERRIREAAKRPRDDTTIDGAFGLWWEEKGKHDAGADDTTFPRLERLQDELTAILAAEGLPATLAEIRTRHLAAYAARRRRQVNARGRLPAPATVNREIQLLRRVMRHAVRVWEKDLRLPDFGAALAAEPDSPGQWIPTSLLDAIRDRMAPEFRDPLDWLVASGLRARAGLEMRPDQVDLDRRVVEIRLKSRKPGGRRFALPLTAGMLALLANNLGRHPDAVFTYRARATRDGRVRGAVYPITYSSFYSAFKRAAAELGRKSLRVHDLRHTAGSTMRAATGDTRNAQGLLGHTRLETTERYTHAIDGELLAAMERAEAYRLATITAPEAPAELPSKSPEAHRPKRAK